MKTLPYFQGTGRRKTSIARVRLVPGEGAVVVNGNDLYFDNRLPVLMRLLPVNPSMRWPGPYEPQERF